MDGTWYITVREWIRNCIIEPIRHVFGSWTGTVKVNCDLIDGEFPDAHEYPFGAMGFLKLQDNSVVIRRIPGKMITVDPLDVLSVYVFRKSNTFVNRQFGGYMVCIIFKLEKNTDNTAGISHVLYWPDGEWNILIPALDSMGMKIVEVSDIGSFKHK